LTFSDHVHDTEESGRSPGRQRHLAKARDLVPLLREHAAEADRIGHLPDAVTKALRDAGFFALQAPRRFGGHEADFRTAFETYAELGRGCGSSSWLAMILSGGSFMASLLDERARKELWGDDSRTGVCSQLTSIGTARVTKGGLLVSGRWQPMSGAHQSEWAIVAVSATEGVSLALLPMTGASIETTWQVTGLRATGSDTVVFDSAFVPDHRLISVDKMTNVGYGADHPDEPLYGATVITALTVTLVGPLLGMGEAALEYTLERLGAASPGATARNPGRADSSSVQSAVADAASLIDTARLRIYRALGDVEHGIGTRAQLDPLVRARVHMDVGTAAKSIREAVGLLLTAVGTGGFALSSPMQRIWRDLEIALRHATISPDLNRESYGRALLGLKPAD
jgi:3-hydroxy-9,10-secoandrosta-1,3,5(10)-triene-9,17-dione monooxygenase